MKLNLTRPLIVFDLETTGLDLVKDRIIQISYIKVYPDGTEERANLFVNPTPLNISPEITNLTGITNEMVAKAKTFKELAPELYAAFKGCDFAGFNSNRFDIPMLAEEFLRASTVQHNYSIDFRAVRCLDALAIYHRMEPRNLAAAYQFYCGRRMEDDFTAHHADGDTEATYRVLMGQLDKYDPNRVLADPNHSIANDMDALNEFSHLNDSVDFAGRFVWKPVLNPDGSPQLDKQGKPLRQEVFNFGKHKGEAVADVVRRDPGFCSWVLQGQFTLDTKTVLQRIMLREKSK